MIDGLPLTALDGLGTVAIVVLVGWLIFTGRLVPRRTYDDVLHDRDEWRTAHRISEQARSESADQVGELLEHARTTDAFIRSLPHPHGEST